MSTEGPDTVSASASDDAAVVSSDENDEKSVDVEVTSSEDGGMNNIKLEVTTNTASLSEHSSVTFRSNLRAGFHSMLMSSKKAAARKGLDDDGKGVLTYDFLNGIVINFVDPTSSTSLASTPVAASTSPTSNDSTPQSAPIKTSNKSPDTSTSPPAAPSTPYPVEVSRFYEKFVDVLQNNYNSTLNYIPIQMFRSGTKGVVENLKLKTVRSEGGILLSSNPRSMQEDGDSSEGATIDDEIENWHLTPYCYVYFAACGNLEHYRTVVKPSIQAFVSQLESTVASSSLFAESPTAASSSSSPSNGTTTNPTNTTTTATPTPAASAANSSSKCPPYVLIFIPTERNKPEESPQKTRRTAVGATVASRLALARRIMTSGAATSASAPVSHDSSNSAGGNATTAEGSGDNQDFDGSDHGGVSLSTSVQSPVHRLSRSEREVLRRMTNDFPAANVCTLSTLADSNKEGKSSADKNENDAVFQKAEWTVVLKAIGNAVGQGFLHRCQRCDDELRRLDHALRRGKISPTSSQDSIRTKAMRPIHSPSQKLFHWNHFFLVKESLAFTYEQMHLYEEAFLQYEELLAFLPSHIDPRTTAKDSKDVSSLIDDLESELSSPPKLSDHKGRLQEKENVAMEALTGNIASFRSGLRSNSNGELISVAPEVVEHYILGREIALLFHMKEPIRVVERCTLFIQYLYKQQLIKLITDEKKAMGTDTVEDKIILEKWALKFCWDVKESSQVLLECDTESEALINAGGKRLLARRLCDLIEFAGRRMKNAGELHFEQTKIIPLELFEQIENSFDQPWNKQAANETNGSLPGDSSSSSKKVDTNFTETAFATRDAFWEQYAYLIRHAVELNESCKRYRYSSRYRLELMSTYLICNDKKRAADQLRSIVDFYGRERWDYCYFTLIFRLASLEREIGTPLQYLTTLVRSFTENTYQTAPARALDTLHGDILNVVRSPSIVGTCFNLAPLFAPIFCLEGLTLPPPGTERNLLKRVYTVGDLVRVTLSLTSFLPKVVEVDGISVSLVPFRIYVAALEDNIPLKEHDAFRLLRLTSPIEIEPGENNFVLEWKPMASGQFIISEMTIRWKEVFFKYAARVLKKRPTIRIDIVPSEPTQKIYVTPKFLVPGHEQPLNISFSAGSDHVKEGSLKLHATPGLLFLSDSEQSSADTSASWVTSLVAPLPPCLPGQTITMTTRVKSELVGNAGDPQEPLLVKLSTLYKYANDESGEGSTGYIDTSLEAKVPTMNKHIVSIKEYDIVRYSIDKALLSVTVLCNTPVPFRVNSWSISLPSHLSMSDGDDVNESLRHMTIEYGELIYLSFDCRIAYNDEGKTSKSGSDAFLSLELLNEYETTFRESMKLENVTRFLLTPNETRPPHLEPVPITMSPSATKGLVGVPINFSVTFDCSMVPEIIGEIVFKITSSDTDSAWLVSGRIEGILQRSKQTIGFVGIPSRPGRLVSYPSVGLVCRHHQSKSNPIPVEHTSESQQRWFDCFSTSSHMTIAFPLSVGSSRTSTAFAI